MFGVGERREGGREGERGREREREGERERRERGEREGQLTEQWAPVLSIPILSSLSWRLLHWHTQPACNASKMKLTDLNVKFKLMKSILFYPLKLFVCAILSTRTPWTTVGSECVHVSVCECEGRMNQTFEWSYNPALTTLSWAGGWDMSLHKLPLGHLSLWVTWLSHDMHMGDVDLCSAHLHQTGTHRPCVLTAFCPLMSANYKEMARKLTLCHNSFTQQLH